MPLSGGTARRAKALSPIPAPRVDDVISSQATEQPMVFKLQLRPLEEPESFKPSVQLVSREFATRYLESVGVRPSKATMDIVNRNVPLAETHIKTTLRAKGHVEDEIHISVPPVTHRYRVPVVINPAAVLQLGIGNSVLGTGPDRQPDAEARPGSSESLDAQLNDRFGGTGQPGDTSGGAAAAAAVAASRAPGGTDFLDMAARYLYPFNLDLTLARKNLTALHVAARAKLMTSGRAAADADTHLAGAVDTSARGAASGGGPTKSVWASTSGRGAGCGGASRGQAVLLGPEGRLGGGPSSARSSSTVVPGGGGGGGRSGSWPRSGRLAGMPDEGGSGGGRSGGLGGGGGGLGGGGGVYDATQLEVLEELAQPLLVSPEVVLTLQAQLEAALADWHRHQAPEALKGRLTVEEFNRTQEELSSEGMVKLLITLVNFLHEELIRGHPSYPNQLFTAAVTLSQGPHSVARESSRHSQLRGQVGVDGPSLHSERSSQTHGSSADGGGSSSGGGGGGAIHTSRRSIAGAAGGGSLRGGSQLPASISTLQMTNLQKYDLGYQAYVRQKLEQRQSQPQQLSSAGGFGGGGTRSQLTTPATDVRGSGSSTHGAGDRLTSTIVATSQSPAQPRAASPQSQPQQQEQPTEAQRVSFAFAPQISGLPISPQVGACRPVSPGHRGGGGGGGGGGPSSSLLGPLNLPCSRPRSNSRPNSSHPNTPAGGGGGGGGARTASPNSMGGGAGEAAEAAPPITGLPPRVSRALRHSPSFALASAANTARSIHSSLGARDMAALQRERLYALHVAWAARFKALRQSRSGMFFTLPILLLAARLCVNLLFSTLYPLWTRLPEGEAVLGAMDAALCALFDPHGYLERALSLLQSTPSAIEAVTRHPQRRGNERRHFADTSALIQATLQGGAKSAGARKLMRSAANQPKGLALMRTQLTAEQRAALFQLGLQWMQQPDPVLSQVGEPHTVGRL